MVDPTRVNVRAAADRLGVSPMAVRNRISSGQLPAVKRGRDWWVDERTVERLARQPVGSGRPFSPEMAWAILLLASGEEDASGRIAGQARYRSRARQWLREHSLAEYAARLRDRAQSEQFDIHPSELARLAGRPDVLMTGDSAANLVGLVGKPSTLEIYAPSDHRNVIVRDHALLAGAGPVKVRWVPSHAWPVVAREGQAPRAAVLVDMLESDDPRARREAAKALAS